MKKDVKNILNKIMISIFLLIGVLYMTSFFTFQDIKAQDYQESSAWYGSDIGVETLNDINYTSDYATLSEIIFDVNAVDTTKKYVIETAYDLYQLSELTRGSNASVYLDLDYVLGNDIDYFDALKINLNYMFTPIGFNQPFTGTFDGQGFEITNLIFRSINSDDEYNQYMPGLIYYAMFSQVGTTGVVKNVGLINPLVVQALNIGSMTYVSTLVGLNEGLVENVYYIDQREESAGINAEGEFIISGLVSINKGTFRNAYVASPYIRSVAVIQNLASSVITYNNTGTIENVYYDQEILNHQGSSTQFGTGLNTSDFQNEQIFSSTWYFKDSYEDLTTDINLYDQLEIDETYPILQGIDIVNEQFMIEDAIDLLYMNELLLISGLFRQATYVLNADIDMKQVATNSYVAAEASFSGTFTSNQASSNTLFDHSIMGGADDYYSIINLTITTPTFIGDYASYSFFAALFGTVEHVNFINYKIEPSELEKVEGTDRLMIAGLSANTDNAIIYDVHLDLTIDVDTNSSDMESLGKFYISGLYAYGQAKVSYTSTIGSIENIDISYDARMTENYISGMIAYGINVDMSYTLNDIKINGLSYIDQPNNTTYIGGIFGYASIHTLYKVINSADITSHQSGYMDTLYVGGIIAYQSDLEENIKYVYNRGDLNVAAYHRQDVYVAGYGFVSDTEDDLIMQSITNNGAFTFDTALNLTNSTLENINYFVSGVLITNQANGKITGIFQNHSQDIELSVINQFAGNVLALDQSNLQIEQSYQEGNIDFNASHDLTHENIAISLNLLGKNININHIRQTGDATIDFKSYTTTQTSGNLYVYGLFEEVSLGFYASNGYQGGNITITKDESTSINYDVYASGIAYANRNIDIYETLNLDYTSIDIKSIEGTMDVMLNSGNILIENDFNGNIKASGILLYNESILTNAINTGHITIENDIATTNDEIEASGITYAMIGPYAQIRNSANNGDITAVSTSSVGFAHASGIVVRNNVNEDGSESDIGSLNQFSKIWFSINYGNIYAYTNVNESSYNIANETTSKASGIFGIGILSIINTINYGDIFSRYLASGLIGFVDYTRFPYMDEDTVYMSNSINYGKVRQITNYTKTSGFTYNMNQSPSSEMPYSFGAIVGKIHTGSTTWAYTGDDATYPIDGIYFGYLLNFDDKINMFASSPDITDNIINFLTGDSSAASAFIIDMLQYMATTNPNDESAEPFTYFQVSAWFITYNVGKVIDYLDFTDTLEEGIFAEDFAFRDAPPALEGTDQYIADYIEYIPAEKANPNLISKLEANTDNTYLGIYAVSSDSGIENGLFIPDNFKLDGLHPYTLDQSNSDDSWVGTTSDTNSLAYALYSEMPQIKLSFASTIYDLEIVQTDANGNEINNGLTLSDPIIDEERSLLTYYIPSNAEIFDGLGSSTVTVSRFVEVSEGSTDADVTVVPNLLVDGQENGYAYIGTHKKVGNSYQEISPYASTGKYYITPSTNESFTWSGVRYTKYNLTNNDADISMILVGSSGWFNTGYTINSTTTVANGYGPYKYSGGIYSYVGPSTTQTTYVRREGDDVTVFDDANVYFKANTTDGTYVISKTASLSYNGQAYTALASIPKSYGTYDEMYDTSGNYIDSVENHYGEVRVFSEEYNASDAATYKDYEIRVIRTAAQDITEINELSVNGIDSLINNPNEHNTTATQDLFYEVDGDQGVLSLSYETYNLANLYNVIPFIEVFDDNTNVKVHSSYYELSGGIVYTDQGFNNTLGEWGSGEVNISLIPADDFPSGDYRFVLSLVTGDTFTVHFSKIASANADVLSFTYEELFIEPITNNYTSYIDYGLYYDSSNIETNIVDFTNLSDLINIYYDQLDIYMPNYLETISISNFATLISIDFSVNVLDGYRHQYQIDYLIEAEDGSTSIFTHYIEEYPLLADATVIYKNGGSLENPNDVVPIYYDESPTVRIVYDFEQVHFANNNILSVTSSFNALEAGDTALLDQDYFVETINEVGFEVDLNQDTAKGDYTYQLNYMQQTTVNGILVTWDYDFTTVNLEKLENDNSNLENVLFATDSVFDEVLDAFVTIVDIDEVTISEYEQYFDDQSPTERIISVLPTSGIDYDIYDDQSAYWIIGQVQETNLTGYLPTFYLPDGASIYRVTDSSQVHYSYQSEVLAADFSDPGDGESLNYIQYRIYAEDFDDNPTHYTDYYVAVQDTTNNIKFDITVLNDTLDLIERVYINVNVYQFDETHANDYEFSEIQTSLRMFSYYNSDEDAYDNNQFATSMYGYYELFIDVPDGYTVEIEYQEQMISGELMYLPSSRIPKRYYVTIHIVENTNDTTDWGHHAVFGYLPQVPEIDVNRTYTTGELFTYNDIVWEVVDGTYTYSTSNPPGTSSWQGLRDNSMIYNENSYYLIDDIVLYEGTYYQLVHGGGNNRTPINGLNNNGWNEVSIYWLSYNVYTAGDIVLYNGTYYEATGWTLNTNPETASYGWQVITE